MTATPRQEEAWSGVAAGYDEYVTPLLIPLAEQILSRADVRDGTRLLDVAAGTGALSIAAARRDADVLATDLAPAMIELLEARARRERLHNLRARVMDALDLALEADQFDVAASQLGVTVIPQLNRALAEMVRVTKPGGTVIIAALGPPQKAEFLGFFLAAMKATIPGFSGPPSDPPPPQFQAADPTRLRDRLAEAGLKDIGVDAITYGLSFASVDQLWGLIMNSNPAGRTMIAELSDEQHEEVKNVLAGMLRERSNGNGAELNLGVNVAIATK